MAEVSVKFVGVLRDVTGGRRTVVDLGEDASLTDLLAALHRRYGQRFDESVLSGSNGVKGHVKLFLNGREIDRRDLSTTRVVVDGVAAQAILYVVPSTAGG